ncbi:gap junction beta-3 protein-like [Ambystoma mexicanum]|uniref:gap junction beta-3 protein-like n=1 Tax=Ambystoma mexicanum TaxID=8296 RepID=UPI0037E77939
MAMVTGLIPILRSAIEATTDYNGRTMWFGFLAVRLVTLYIAEMPWSKVDLDFQCDVNASEFCRKDCFNAHFNIPMVSLWNFTFILFIISVLLMELFASQLRYNLIKAKLKHGAHSENLANPALTGVKSHELATKDIMIDFHHEKKMLVLYLFCVLLRLIIELGFLYALFFCQLPKVDGAPISCSTQLCTGPYVCLVRAAVEKRMAIFMLCTISLAIMCTCILFAFYTTCHYLVFGRNHHGSCI